MNADRQPVPPSPREPDDEYFERKLLEVLRRLPTPKLPPR